MSDVTVEHILEAESAIRPDGALGRRSHALDGVIDLIAGSAGGVANVYSGQPLDTVKVKMQTFSHLYRSSVACFVGTFRADGIRGLYAGTVPALAANIGENAVLFTAYGFCQKGVAALTRGGTEVDVRLLHPAENALAGSLAAVFASLALCPTELIKCRLQAVREMRATGSGTLAHSDAALRIPRQVDVRLLHPAENALAGSLAAMFASLALCPTELIKCRLQAVREMRTTGSGTLAHSDAALRIPRQVDVRLLHPAENALAGSLAAVFASLALCPTELIKCRLQAVREMRATGSGTLAHSDVALRITPFSLTRQILRDEGIRGMFRGLTPTFAREVPGYFFFFGGYETCRSLLTPSGKTKDDIGVLKTAFSGGIGGTCLWLTVFPADVVKSRVQIKGEGQFVPVLMEILRKEGFRALYTGLAPTLVRTFIASGALLIAYEYTKKTLTSLVG